MDAKPTGQGDRRGPKRVRIDAGQPVLRIPHAGFERRESLHVSLPSDVVLSLRALAVMRRSTVSGVIEPILRDAVKGVVCYQRGQGQGQGSGGDDVPPVPSKSDCA